MMLHNIYHGFRLSGLTEEDGKHLTAGMGPFLTTEPLFEQIWKSTTRWGYIPYIKALAPVISYMKILMFL